MEYKIQFSRSNTILSKAICLYTGCWASHVEFVLPSGRILGSIAGKGVCLTDPDENYARVEQFYVAGPIAKAMDVASRQLGKPYDYQAISGIALRRDWHDVDKWICSELIAWSFEIVKHPLIRARPHKVTPRDLLMSPYLIPAKP